MTLKARIDYHASAALLELLDSGQRDCGISWGRLLRSRFTTFALEMQGLGGTGKRAKRRKR